MTDLSRYAWSEEELARALERLAELTGLPWPAFELPSGTADLGGETLLARAAEAAGLRLLSQEGPGDGETRRRLHPALLRVVADGRAFWLLAVPSRGGRLLVEDPAGGRHLVELSRTLSAEASSAGGAATAPGDAVSARLGSEARRRARWLLGPPDLTSPRIERAFELELPASASWVALARRYAFLRRAVALLGVEFAALGLSLGLWAWIGSQALASATPGGALVGWGLGWMLLAPTRWLAGRMTGAMVLDLSEALQRRLLAGALRLDPGSGPRSGTGTFFAQAFEAERFEALLLEAGLQAVSAGVELWALGAIVLWARPEAALVLWLALGFAAATLLASGAHLRRGLWTSERLAVLAAGVEQILGHRTRLAQGSERADREAELRQLGRLDRAGADLDRATVALEVWVSRFWTLGAALIVFWNLGSEKNSWRIAAHLAVVLFAERALTLWGSTLQTLSAARIAARALKPLLSPPARSLELPELAVPERPLPLARSEVVLECRGVELHPPGRRRPTLAGVSGAAKSGDRILLEGASGQGKSTLLRVLAGLCRADRGTLRLRGFDRSAFGDRLWRQRVALVPQFQENHLYAGSMAFNLLLGRRWPPSPEDLEAAVQLCAELGLEDLVERMPLGLMQPVGEGGWQLSHGERARVFLARALLQPNEMLLLDESLAGLDGATARLVLAAAEQRSRALLVVAHV